MTDAEVVSLKEYILALLAERDKATKAAVDELNRRLLEMNDFRRAMGDLSGTMATRNEMERFREEFKESATRNDKEIAGLRESRAELSGKASQADVNRVQLDAFIARFIAIGSALISLLALIKAIIS